MARVILSKNSPKRDSIVKKHQLVKIRVHRTRFVLKKNFESENESDLENDVRYGKLGSFRTRSKRNSLNIKFANFLANFRIDKCPKLNCFETALFYFLNIFFCLRRA